MIAAVLGWAVLLAGAGALALVVGRRAAAHGILVPVAVGLGLRVVVMAIAHIGSLSLDDGGIMFLDDRTYLRGGDELAAEWRAGRTPDPSAYELAGTYQFGYQAFVGLLFTLGTTSVLLGKAVNVLLGTATIYVVARIAGRVLGDRAQVRAAWVAALAPTMVWWSAPLMKEALATLLVALGVLAVVSLPRRGAVIGLGAVAAALVLVRLPAAIALFTGTGAAVAVAGWRAEGRWLSRPLVAFGATVLAGLAAIVLVVPQGNPVAFFDQYRDTAGRMFDQYQGSDPLRWPYDVLKSLVTPLPWVFDEGTRNWDRALYPGVWLLICAYPLALLGIRRLWGRPELVLLLGTAVTALAVNAGTSGFTFRQRAVVEPLVLLLVVAGTPSWRVACRGASAALGAVAVAAGVQSRSPALALAVAGAAGVLFYLSTRLPAREPDPLPPSPMVEGLRRLPFVDRIGRTGASRVAADVVWLGRSVRAAGASAVRSAVRAAPQPRIAPRADGPGTATRLRRALTDLAPRR